MKSQDPSEADLYNMAEETFKLVHGRAPHNLVITLCAGMKVPHNLVITLCVSMKVGKNPMCPHRTQVALGSPTRIARTPMLALARSSQEPQLWRMG